MGSHRRERETLREKERKEKEGERLGGGERDETIEGRPPFGLAGPSWLHCREVQRNSHERELRQQNVRGKKVFFSPILIGHHGPIRVVLIFFFQNGFK